MYHSIGSLSISTSVQATDRRELGTGVPTYVTSLTIGIPAESELKSGRERITFIESSDVPRFFVRVVEGQVSILSARRS